MNPFIWILCDVHAMKDLLLGFGPLGESHVGVSVLDVGLGVEFGCLKLCFVLV